MRLPSLELGGDSIITKTNTISLKNEYLKLSSNLDYVIQSKYINVEKGEYDWVNDLRTKVKDTFSKNKGNIKNSATIFKRII